MSKQSRIRTQELRQAQQEAARKEAKRRRLLTALGGLVIVGLVAAIIVAVVQATQGGDSPSSSAPGKVVQPANASDWSIPVGDKDAPVTVAIYYDYMCPACGALEAANGDELDRLLEDGTARIELRPISFLDKQSSGTEYSTRAGNAIATVADGAPEHVWELHQALYAEQPEEGSEGLSDEQIAEIATDAGVPSAVVARFTEDTYEGWIAAATEAAFDSGVEGTPTVLIDGERFEGDVYKPGPLTEAIESAAGK
ncbi:MAG TPA: DsbA family protein [Marmoricola sp.]|nr:DsbA family protein [Marmoricola sp.]